MRISIVMSLFVVSVAGSASAMPTTLATNNMAMAASQSAWSRKMAVQGAYGKGHPTAGAMHATVKNDETLSSIRSKLSIATLPVGVTSANAVVTAGKLGAAERYGEALAALDLASEERANKRWEAVLVSRTLYRAAMRTAEVRSYQASQSPSSAEGQAAREKAIESLQYARAFARIHELDTPGNANDFELKRAKAIASLLGTTYEDIAK